MISINTIFQLLSAQKITFTPACVEPRGPENTCCGELPLILWLPENHLLFVLENDALVLIPLSGSRRLAPPPPNRVTLQEELNLNIVPCSQRSLEKIINISNSSYIFHSFFFIFINRIRFHLIHLHRILTHLPRVDTEVQLTCQHTPSSFRSCTWN